MPEVYLIEEAIKEIRLLAYFGRQSFQCLHHPPAVRTLHDHDHIFVVAELGQVLPPALLVVFVRIDQVAALRTVFEKMVERVSGNGGEECGQGENQLRITADCGHETGQETGNELRLLPMGLFRFHEMPLASVPTTCKEAGL